MATRKATSLELDQVYMMGFDVWGKDSSRDDYLDACRNSQKYQKGTWYVYEVDNIPVSSLIVYESGFSLPPQCAGIGSVATGVEHRKNGYASLMIDDILNSLRNQGKRGVYLFADIHPEFYEKLGFKAISVEQPYKGTCCMVNVFAGDEALVTQAPGYF